MSLREVRGGVVGGVVVIATFLRKLFVRPRLKRKDFSVSSLAVAEG